MTERWVNEDGDEVVVRPTPWESNPGFYVDLETERKDVAWHSYHEEFGKAAETAAYLMVEIVGGSTWRRMHHSDWRDEAPGAYRDQQERIARAQASLFGGRALWPPSTGSPA